MMLLRATDVSPPALLVRIAPGILHGLPAPGNRFVRRLQLAETVAPTDGARLDDAGVNAAEIEGPAGGRVDEFHRVDAEPFDEFAASSVRLRGDLDDGRAGGQPGAGRQIVSAQIQVGVELIPRQSPAGGVLSDKGRRPGVHQRQLGVGVRRGFVRGLAVDTGSPAVTDEALGGIEPRLFEDVAFADLRPPHDQLKFTRVAWRVADAAEAGLEFGAGEVRDDHAWDFMSSPP